MGQYIITFRTVTPAQRGETTLQQAGFRCGLRRTPKWMEAQGCGYSVWVTSEDIDSVIRLLRQRRIPYRKVYRKDTEGEVEEMPV